jgi:hypothetical protein
VARTTPCTLVLNELERTRERHRCFGVAGLRKVSLPLITLVSESILP